MGGGHPRWQPQEEHGEHVGDSRPRPSKETDISLPTGIRRVRTTMANCKCNQALSGFGDVDHIIKGLLILTSV